MSITDIETYWKQDLRLKDRLGDVDGDYPITFGEAKTESRKDGMYELLEVPVVEQNTNNEAKISIFYISKNEFNENGIDRLKKLSDMVDPGIRQKSATFHDSLNTLSVALFGRSGVVNQRESDGKLWFDVVEVGPALKAPAAPSKPFNAKEELLTESDIPF